MKTMLLAAFAVLTLSAGGAAPGHAATATTKGYGQAGAEIHWDKYQHTK